MVKLEMTGEQIKQSLEHSVRMYPEQNGGFLQVSGLRFAFDPAKPEGERVTEIAIRGQPLEMDKKYTVASNDFIAAGGDGYRWMSESTLLTNTGELLSTAVIRLIQENESFPEIENRIRIE